MAGIGPPVAAWALGTTLTAVFTSQVAGWYVMTDELQHVKLALSIGDGLSLRPRLHGADVEIYSQLYPVLTAPLYALLSMPTAFDAVHVFNAVAMASAAVPVYILSRELGIPKLAATVVATASVMTPWMVLATMVMTEVVAYPAFAWAILAIQRAAARPSPQRDLLALVALAVAFFARTQFIGLAGLYVAVAVLHPLVYALVSARAGDRAAALRRAPNDFVRGHPFLTAAALVLAGLPLTGYSYAPLLGSYGGAAKGDLFPPRLVGLAVEHLDFIAVGVGVIPLVAAVGWALAVAFRPTTKGHHAFALVILVSVPLLSLQVSSFLLRFADGGVHDRYLFYLAPILFVGLAVCLYADVRRSSFVGMAAAGAGFFLVANDIEYDASDPVFFATPAAVFHRVLAGQADRLGDLLDIESLSPTPLIQLTAVTAAIGLPLALRHLPRRSVVAFVGLGVFAFSAVQCVYVFDKVVDADDGLAGTDWIDQRVPDDAEVGLVPFPIGGFPPRIWWNVEFWNKSVTRSYSAFGRSGYTSFPEGELEINARTGELTSRALTLAPYLVMHQKDRRFRPAGHVVAKNKRPELELLELQHPATAVWTADGFDHGGTFPTGAEIRLYGGGGRGQVRRRITFRIAASVQIDPALPPGPQERRRFDLRGPGVRRQGVLRPGEKRRETVEICIPRGGSTTFTITGTGAGRHGAAPGIEGLPIGVKVGSIRVETLSRACL